MNMETIEAFTHTRQFGIELEFFNIEQQEVKRLLAIEGIPSYIDGHEDNVVCGNQRCRGVCEKCKSAWKISDDGSINGDMSVELISPILGGKTGLKVVHTVVSVLSKNNAKVNKSCGFHVHVNAQDLSGEVLINVYKRYALHEAQIDAFMAPSRRRSDNTYCRSTVEFLGMLPANTNAPKARNVALAMEERWNSQLQTYDGGRYNKVNLCAFLRHGTIEFRHHAGTMNVNKVLNWVMFCVNFVNVSQNSETKEIFDGLHANSVEFFNTRRAELS